MTTTQQTPSPQKSRAGSRQRPGFLLQARDLAIVQAVIQHRVLSTNQIAALFFDPENGLVSSACRHRLRLLTKSGFLERHFQLQQPHDGRLPHLFMPTLDGLELVVRELGDDPGDFAWQPDQNNVGWIFLQHQMALNDIYVQLATATMPPGWEMIEWVDDRILKKRHTQRVEIEDRGKKDRVGVVPDAYVAFSIGGGQKIVQFFIEADRGTMAATSHRPIGHSWQRRILAYNEIFNQGVLKQDYQTRSMRVLTVTPSQERARNLKEATEAAGGKTRYWFASKTALEKSNPFSDPIWVRATDDALRSLAKESSELVQDTRNTA